MVIEGQVDQVCAFSDLRGVVASVKVWPELAFEFGEGLFTVGSLGVNQGGAAVVEFGVGESEQAGGSPTFMLGGGGARQPENGDARVMAEVLPLRFAQGVSEGRARGGELAAAKIYPAEIDDRNRTLVTEFAEDCPGLLEVMPCGLQVIITEG